MKQHPIYNVNYFIEKFSAIPEELWCTERFINDDNQCCAQGHCGLRYTNAFKVWNQRLETIPKDLHEGWHLFEIFNRVQKNIADINNGNDKHYTQPTPKQRVLAALYDIKAMIEPKEQPREDVTKELAVLPIDETADIINHKTLQS